MAPPVPEPLRRDPLAGTAYQAIRRLGGGATADVCEAVHTALDKRVVVKLLHAELAGQAMALERMRFEAKALARLSHPNLTAVTDFGQTAEGRPFFVMERHEGRLLLAELRRRGFLPVVDAVGVVRQLLAGLSAAHAIGVVHRDLKKDAGRVQHALRMAKASYRIQHENVVAVHDLGCEDDGKVWIQMELLEGSSLSTVLARATGRISVRLAFHVAVSAGWGIDAAHELQILHRDIKPDNLWITSRGLVKVLDWSIAKVIPDGVATTKKTTGLGTAPYVSPEMLRGRDVDARADVYALGVVLYEMLAGQHPFADVLRNTAEMIRRQLFVEPAPLSTVSGLPPYVDDFMRRAICKDPDGRFTSMGEMVKAMIELRVRLEADASRGLIRSWTGKGEPPVCDDPRGERAYLPPVPPPALAPAEPEPSRRVVVPAAAGDASKAT